VSVGRDVAGRVECMACDGTSQMRWLLPIAQRLRRAAVTSVERGARLRRKSLTRCVCRLTHLVKQRFVLIFSVQYLLVRKLAVLERLVGE